MSDADTDLKALQAMIARRLAPLGRVFLSVVCRTAYKILVTHHTGACVRVLICREHDTGRPFVNIMPLPDPTERGLCDDSRTFHGVLPEDVSLDLITQQVKATLAAAISGASTLPPPRPH